MERPDKPTLVVTLDDRTRDIIKPLNNYIFDLEVYAGYLESSNQQLKEERNDYMIAMVDWIVTWAKEDDARMEIIKPSLKEILNHINPAN